VMPLTSGYVERARATLPQQGDANPWTVPQNYPLDLLQMRRADVTRDMQFEPARTAERTDDRVAEQVAS
jgi:monooxygenase